MNITNFMNGNYSLICSNQFQLSSLTNLGWVTLIPITLFVLWIVYKLLIWLSYPDTGPI